MEFRKVKGGTDVYLGALLIASLTFGKKRGDEWPVFVNSYRAPPYYAANMREALIWLHAQFKVPVDKGTP